MFFLGLSSPSLLKEILKEDEVMQVLLYTGLDYLLRWVIHDSTGESLSMSTHLFEGIGVLHLLRVLSDTEFII